MANRIDQDSLSDVRTVVSELVAVSVANGARELIEVSIDLDDGDLEGVLCDDGTGARAVSRGDSSSLVARIIDGLVEEWEASDVEKRIRFRMNVQPVSGGPS